MPSAAPSAQVTQSRFTAIAPIATNPMLWLSLDAAIQVALTSARRLARCLNYADHEASVQRTRPFLCRRTMPSSEQEPPTVFRGVGLPCNQEGQGCCCLFDTEKIALARPISETQKRHGLRDTGPTRLAGWLPGATAY